MTSPFRWIKPDETAKEALARILTDLPFVVLPPPLHRLPFRVGNVVEIVGPSPSAKTLILIQAAVDCILPKEWKGVQYGGLDRAVIFVDLECRFDVLSLARVLKQRMNGGGRINVKWSEDGYDKELFTLCMKRSYISGVTIVWNFLLLLKQCMASFRKRRKH